MVNKSDYSNKLDNITNGLNDMMGHLDNVFSAREDKPTKAEALTREEIVEQCIYEPNHDNVRQERARGSEGMFDDPVEIAYDYMPDADDIPKKQQPLEKLEKNQGIVRSLRIKKKEKITTIEKMYKSLKKNIYDGWPKILDRSRRNNAPWINGEFKNEPPIQFCTPGSIKTYKYTMKKAVDDFINYFGAHHQMTRRQFAGIINPLLYNQDTQIFSDYSAGRTYTTSLKRIYIHAVRNNLI